MIFTFLIILAVLWLILSFTAYYFVKKAFKKYKNYPRIEVPVNMEPTIRKDFGKWDEAAIVRGCFLRFPLHFWMMVSFLGGYCILTFLQKYLKYPDSFIDFFRSKYGRLTCRVTSNLIEQFNSDEDITTPIIISNHVNWIDFIYMGACLTLASFVAKKQIQQTPVFNTLATYLKALWVDRSSAEARAKIKQSIGKRVEEYQKDPKTSRPIIIYAEGTVTNGRSVISFKNGAFDPLCPITIICLKYQCKEFHMGFDQITTLEHAFISLCLNFTLRVFKEVIEPLPTDTVDTYRERCRQKMCQMSGFKKYDSDYKDILAYAQQFKQFLKEKKAAAAAARNAATQ